MKTLHFCCGLVAAACCTIPIFQGAGIRRQMTQTPKDLNVKALYYKWAAQSQCINQEQKYTYFVRNTPNLLTINLYQ